jgi:predicted transposase/invertase (TIGR01784 family)
MKINRRNDYAFKRLFGREDTKDILASLLSAILEVPIEPDELTLIHTEITPEFLADKASFLDIHVRQSAHHEKMIVEMQARDEHNLERRTLHYWSRSFSEELKKGQDYSELPRVIHIAIVNFDVFDWGDATKFHGVFQVRERSDMTLFSDALEIHIIELPKMARRKKHPEDYTSLERWAVYFNNTGGKIMEQIAECDPAIKKVMSMEEIFVKDEQERYLYELRERGQHDFDNAVISAEKRGELEGLRKTARSMLEGAVSLDLISKFTGLPIDEIESLKRF